MRRPRRPRDFAQLAKLVVDIATGQAQDPPIPEDTPTVAARRRSGVRGGKARAKRLSARRRKEIARKAARARWSTEISKVKSIP